MKERILRGIPVSAGIALGSVYVHGDRAPEIPEYDIAAEVVPAEIARFQKAVEDTRKELSALQTKIQKQAGKDFAEFIDVLLLLLGESDTIGGTIEVIRQRRKNAEFAYAEVTHRLTAPLVSSQVTFVHEKLADVADVANRVLRRLLGRPMPSVLGVPTGAVIVAHDLPPSDATLLDSRRVAGVALETGGKTSHAALMTKTKGIPLVTGIENLMQKVVTGESVIVDGYRGIVVVTPTHQRLDFYKQEQARLEKRRTLLFKQLDAEPVTLDGKHLDVMANVGFAGECDNARHCGARGIGLFRSEYLLIARRRPPTEDEQYQTFADLARKMKPYPVVIRTFDLGGDKVLPGYSEANPFLGWRAIRFCIDNRDFFKTQLRAILRASASGNIRMMFPMIATLEELRRAKLIVEETKQELRREGIPFDEQISPGIMIEIPSAALMAGALARECSFFSIGSNDLTMYALAVDRSNERVARLYDQFHPAVLRLIKLTIDAAHQNEIAVALCGEFASDALGLVILIGLGIDELSMVPGMIPQSVGVIRTCDRGIAKDIVENALRKDTSLEVTRYLRREIDKKLPQLAGLLFQNTNPARAALSHEGDHNHPALD
jgi:phosphotransferase system enzyme I (PtsI)